MLGGKKGGEGEEIATALIIRQGHET